MIAFVEGTVAAIHPDAVVLDVSGVGYRVFVDSSTLAASTVGARLKLHTHHLVRADAMALYGFRAREELAFFELLLTVTGVGPRVSLAILASRPVADLQLAIFQGDMAMLTSVPGVGKRLAGRIVLELKEKVSAAGAQAGGDGSPGVSESEVVAALQALGYASGEAREAARSAVASLPPGSSLEDRVRGALRGLRRD